MDEKTAGRTYDAGLAASFSRHLLRHRYFSLFPIPRTRLRLCLLLTGFALGTSGCANHGGPVGGTPSTSLMFAYVANKGSNNVSAFTIDPRTGALTAVGSPAAAGTSPLSVAVDPTGKFAYVANFMS